jgi:membrane associated rhomboid family serine protease
MFIPLHDANSLKHIDMQYVTIALIVTNVVVFALTALSSDEFVNAAVIELGYIPSTISNIAERPPELTLVPDYATYVTYAFLHTGILHLGGNMMFLWVFGDNVEDALGHFRYLVFYLLCAIAGAFVHGVAAGADSQAPLIGASGAIAGVVTAYLILHPRVKIWVLVFARVPLRLPAYIVLALWIGFQFIMVVGGSEEQVSWAAHVGGILAGAVLVLILKRRDQPVLDRELVTPRSVRVEQPSAVEPQPAAPAPRWGRQ